MNESEYDKLLDWVQNDCGGIGPKTVQSIKDEFSDGSEFVKACREGYNNENYNKLTQIDGIGWSYARGKLSLSVADYYDWSGGDAEPVEIEVKK